MPNYSQVNLITIFNTLLKEKRYPGIKLNEGGVCAGLTAMYIKEYINGNFDQHIDNLKLLAKNNPQEMKKNTSQVDQLARDIMVMFSPKSYNPDINQTDIEKYLTNNEGQRINKDFQIALVSDDYAWRYILKHLKKLDGAVMQVNSHNHSMAVRITGDTFILYDPNFPCFEKRFLKASELLREIKICFDYNSFDYGLAINVFNVKDLNLLPNKETLLKNSFSANFDDIDKGEISTVNGVRYRRTSLHFAVDEGDSETVEYLIANGADPKIEFSANSSAIGFAVLRGRSKITKKLLDSCNQIELQQAYDVITRGVRYSNEATIDQIFSWYQSKRAEQPDQFLAYHFLLEFAVANINKGMYRHIKQKYIDHGLLNNYFQHEPIVITILEKAIKQNHIEAAEDLIKNSKPTPAFIINNIKECILSNHNEMFEVLIQHININILTVNSNNNNNGSNNLTDLYKAAIDANNSHVIAWFISNKLEADRQSFDHALAHGTRDIIKAMLKQPSAEGKILNWYKKLRKPTKDQSKNKTIIKDKTVSALLASNNSNATNKEEFYKINYAATIKNTGLKYRDLAIINDEPFYVKEALSQMDSDDPELKAMCLLACRLGHKDIIDAINQHGEMEVFDDINELKPLFELAVNKRDAKAVNCYLNVGMSDLNQRYGLSDSYDVIEYLIKNDLSEVAIDYTINPTPEKAYHYAYCAISQQSQSFLDHILPSINDSDPNVDLSRAINYLLEESYKYNNDYACQLLLKKSKNVQVSIDDEIKKELFEYALRGNNLDVIKSLMDNGHITNEDIINENYIKANIVRYPSKDILDYTIDKGMQLSDDDVKSTVVHITRNYLFDSLNLLIDKGISNDVAGALFLDKKNIDGLVTHQSFTTLKKLLRQCDIHSAVKNSSQNNNNNNNISVEDENIKNVYVWMLKKLVKAGREIYSDTIFNLISTINFDLTLVNEELDDNELNQIKDILFKEPYLSEMSKSDQFSTIAKNNEQLAKSSLKSQITQAAMAGISVKTTQYCDLYKILNFSLDDLIDELINDEDSSNSTSTYGQYLRDILKSIHQDDITGDTYDKLMDNKIYAYITFASCNQNQKESIQTGNPFTTSAKKKAKRSQPGNAYKKLVTKRYNAQKQRGFISQDKVSDPSALSDNLINSPRQ